MLTLTYTQTHTRTYAYKQKRVERSLHFTLERVNENVLCFTQSDEYFCLDISFSRCEFNLAVHDIEQKTAGTLHFDSIFKVKDPEFDPAIKFIHGCKEKLWPPYNLEKHNQQV